MSNYGSNDTGEARAFGDSTTRDYNDYDATNRNRNPDINTTTGSADPDIDRADKVDTLGAFGQGPPSSGALDETNRSSFTDGIRKKVDGGLARDSYGSANNGPADPSPSTTTTAAFDDVSSRNFDHGPAMDYEDLNAGSAGANAGYGAPGARSTGGEAGKDYNFLDTAAGAHPGVGDTSRGDEDRGDSKVGKIMEKAGAILGSDKLQQKGQQRRGEKLENSYGGTD